MCALMSEIRENFKINFLVCWYREYTNKKKTIYKKISYNVLTLRCIFFLWPDFVQGNDDYLGTHLQRI